MIKNSLILVFLISCLTGRSQTINGKKLELIQGIWAGIMNSESEYLYKITNGNKSLGVSFTNLSSVSGFYLNESIEGFQNYKYGEVDSINIKWLSQGGKYYTSIIDEDQINKDGWVSSDYCIIPNYFECDGELMSINGGQLVEYSKLKELPFEALDKLYKRGQLDKRDYLKEYLNLNVTAIKPLNCFVYSKPTKRTNLQLNKDHVVIIIGQTSKWLKIKYDENAVGWIRKEDAK